MRKEKAAKSGPLSNRFPSNVCSAREPDLCAVVRSRPAAKHWKLLQAQPTWTLSSLADAYRLIGALSPEYAGKKGEWLENKLKRLQNSVLVARIKRQQ